MRPFNPPKRPLNTNPTFFETPCIYNITLPTCYKNASNNFYSSFSSHLQFVFGSLILLWSEGEGLIFLNEIITISFKNQQIVFVMDLLIIMMRKVGTLVHCYVQVKKILHKNKYCYLYRINGTFYLLY